MISPEIFNTIQDQVKSVIAFSQNIEEPKVTELLKRWIVAKGDIISILFKGQLTYEIPEPVTFELSEDAKRQRLESFITYLSDIIPSEYDNDIFRYAWDLLPEEFYSNSLTHDYTKWDGKIIPKGTKVVKSFKYFIKDQRLLTEIQNKASEYIQENKVTGKLCFSVHPLDFLSSSENRFNWRSCHALDGDYRAGNLSYMLDRSTIICYLKSNDDVILPNFPESVPWNNKKWRCLLFLSDNWDAMFAGRQYPFFSPGALDIVREHLVCRMPARYWSWWHNDYLNNLTYADDRDYIGISDNVYCIINNVIYNKNDIISDAKGSKHFNDLLFSSCYIPYYMYCKVSRNRDLHFTIGASIPCLVCEENEIDRTESMCCASCYNELYDDDDRYTECECCGRRVERDMTTWVGDDLLCPECLDSETFECEMCGYREWNCHKNYINDKFVCNCCSTVLAQVKGEEDNGC